MFRHRNKGRKYIHDLQLAALLSVVAGVVNIVGVLWLGTLTTNVTGHFAFFSEELFQSHYKLALVSILFLLSFFIGAFITNTTMEMSTHGTAHYSYTSPLMIETFLLGFVALVNLPIKDFFIWQPCLMLLAMGMQNALVTKVSGSVVRTTHLTGLFTDLGIELSQLIFYKKIKDQSRLKKSITLKGVIIAGFFLGGLIGAFSFPWLDRKTLLIPVLILLVALYYDRILLGYYRFRRKH